MDAERCPIALVTAPLVARDRNATRARSSAAGLSWLAGLQRPGTEGGRCSHNVIEVPLLHPLCLLSSGMATDRAPPHSQQVSNMGGRGSEYSLDSSGHITTKAPRHGEGRVNPSLSSELTVEWNRPHTNREDSWKKKPREDATPRNVGFRAQNVGAVQALGGVVCSSPASLGRKLVLS